ncbi:Aspartokinase [Hondaea fermentalgiana]|uniref:Aspartokinase n=1 Tax=Hondaea fermentalgiana TaxID=2315210 RepID=A0A2R5GXQ1_9STRA|nr:Aspartokinase [Hondaea fermentalgiana]|eukprot:GBG33201.1 Aspartokinase [Hondaea fermentalgiana]
MVATMAGIRRAPASVQGLAQTAGKRWMSAAASSDESRLLVQKFGGTSLGTAEKMEKVRNIISSHYSEEKGQNVVAVVSALSSETKEEGTTSRLLAAASGAVAQGEYLTYLEKIEDTHMEVIYSMLSDRKNREDAKQFVQTELDRTRSFCESLGVIREISPRSHDMVIGCGERLSAGLTAAVLREVGLRSVNVDLSKAFPSGLDTHRRSYQHTAKRVFGGLLKPIIKDGVIPVVTGFFGSVEGGIIKGVGRGYTDLTAALCAGALTADELQVWKESDGVFTGHPGRIDQARLLSLITPEEASELTYFGNEVLHASVLDCAIEDKVPINILNTFKPETGGTSITPASADQLAELRGKKCQGIAAVCSKKGVPVLNLGSNRMLDSTSFLATVFEKFASHRVKADLVSTSVSNITVTLHESTSLDAIKTLIADLEELGQVDFSSNRAIVSCIGSGMKHQRGLASSVFHVLSNAGISLEMISQGVTETNISVVLPEDQMLEAINVIHEKFLSEP